MRKDAGGPPTDDLEPGCTWERVDNSTPEGAAAIDAMVEGAVVDAIENFREFVADNPAFWAGRDIARYELEVAARVREISRAEIAKGLRRNVH